MKLRRRKSAPDPIGLTLRSDYLTRKTWSSMGYLKIVGVILIPYGTALVILFSTQFGPLGWPIVVALITAPIYYFNAARKHGRSEAFDDRLNDQRMKAAQEEIMAIWKKKEEED
jgi:hypothetical protein